MSLGNRTSRFDFPRVRRYTRRSWRELWRSSVKRYNVDGEVYEFLMLHCKPVSEIYCNIETDTAVLFPVNVRL